MNRTAFALAALGMLLATEAHAHARLIAANPRANATVAAPKQIVLRFSEKLQPKFSGLVVSKGGARVPMRETIGKDRHTLVAAPARPLAPGAYRVAWHAVGADAHRMAGGYGFVVR